VISVHQGNVLAAEVAALVNAVGVMNPLWQTGLRTFAGSRLRGLATHLETLEELV
jgi:hypothetical protein